MKTFFEVIVVIFCIGCIIALANLDKHPVSNRADSAKERFYYRITGIGGPVSGGTEVFETENYGEVRDGGYHPGCIAFKDYKTGEQIRLCGSYSVRKVNGDPK